MTTETKKKPGTPGRLSRWMQHRANARLIRKVRDGKGTFWGMDVLVLHTVGRRSGQQRETPLAWFDDGSGSRVVVASGGGSHHPDWHANLFANAAEAAYELPGEEPIAATPERLEGEERERVWQVVAKASPQIAKYQAKSDRVYPLIRLSAR
ncbi:deazaflavin-dependent oxidoreductase (nitroreductase family) [Nocardioides albertanoniae]|uniref:Deazaflavin-dependent oxidoreductase (Nitroreductase family) n=1 Tax=Nocardioides albertanoniae TaxID=1175486 RepID=A0A543A7N0_9ACTN|nr:nitroreductase family deazaflavin-dependent oxidoreductase [Nocardioides albertanoniae]TQL68613.1 deazaflavin-dependent oxidoreductase (nitroreductase family) [Nocardioides albertanoniae]